MRPLPTQTQPTSDPGQWDEQALVEACRAQLPHDTSAFTELLRRHEPSVYSVCYRYLGNRADAEELSQDVFLQVFHHFGQFQGRSAFSTWLYTIVRHACLRRLSRIQRRLAVEAEAGAQAGPATTNPEARLVAVDHVNAVLGRLDPDDREVIVLRHLAGLSIAEVAEILGIGLSAAKMRLSRAIEAFKASYARLSEPRPAPFHRPS